jgi:secreted trypsin-like serine protease
MKVYLNATDHEECVKAHPQMQISVSQICAGGVRGKDTCNGDSGGPLQIAHYDANCVYDIVGLTSYGSRRCGSRSFGVYTKVSSHLDWIEQTVWEEDFRKWKQDGRKLD